ncbi:hypothetical protein M758_1G179400 [Ceratodon purpureus]|uniref:Uncharacterized protein n=1 Tax=Ceratodon purpureus TaxID=3225 RepID=A0A8T0J999_CERPU|nr:hypothetical protein KC19_1G182400 [Ceratodon purpureus]KAG0630458.1 hypothetical protein M758_1G179400 [Ceratodon purpureus]
MRPSFIILAKIDGYQVGKPSEDVSRAGDDKLLRPRRKLGASIDTEIDALRQAWARCSFRLLNSECSCFSHA